MESMAPQSSRKLHHPTGIRGYSLVELLVAAAILGVLVLAVIAVVRKGRELQVNDNNRRRARALIHAKFEADYDFRDFNSIPGDTAFSYTDTLDERQGNPVVDSVFIQIHADTPSVSATPIPTKKVTITVKWSETGISSDEIVIDSVKISKWLAKAKE